MSERPETSLVKCETRCQGVNDGVFGGRSVNNGNICDTRSALSTPAINHCAAAGGIPILIRVVNRAAEPSVSVSGVTDGWTKSMVGLGGPQITSTTSLFSSLSSWLPSSHAFVSSRRIYLEPICLCVHRCESGRYEYNVE